MKKLLVLLFLFFSIHQIPAGDRAEIETTIPIDIYNRIFGVWDVEAFLDVNTSSRSYSWGIGEYVKNVSVQIDYDLYQQGRGADFQGLNLYEIISIHNITEDIYKIELYDDYEDSYGVIYIHLVEDNKIWFETEAQYNFNNGKITSQDIPYGEFAYSNGDVITGPENLYHRRAGPGM